MIWVFRYLNLYHGRYKVVQGWNSRNLSVSVCILIKSVGIKAMTRKLWPWIASTFLFFFLHPSIVFSFEFTSDFKMGYFWMNFPILFTVNPSGLSEDDLKITEDALVDAMETWYSQADSPIRVWEFIPWDQVQGNGGVQVVKWSSDFTRETGYSALGTMAVTIRQSTTPFIRKSDIIVNSTHTSLRNQENLTLVLVHELGHTLGLDHSNQVGAVMYSSLSFGPMANRELSEDDINGYNAVVAENINRQKNGSALTQKSSALPFLPSCSGSSAVKTDTATIDGLKEFTLNFISFLVSTSIMILIILGAGKFFSFLEAKSSKFHSPDINDEKQGS